VEQSHNSTHQINRLVSRLRQHMSRFGYESVDLPIIEDANLFLIKAGDQVIKQLFTFERQGKHLALRPEFTAAAAYHYVTSDTAGSAARWQFSGPVFVDDPNDFSGNPQRLSIGAELIGMKGAAAEAEIIAMAVQGLTMHDVTDWHLTIGHAGLIRQNLARFGLDARTQRFLLHQFTSSKSDVLKQFDNLFTSTVEALPLSVASGETQAMGGRTREEIIQRLNQKRRRTAEREQVVAALESLEQWNLIQGKPDIALPALKPIIAKEDRLSAAILKEWCAVMDLLAAYDVPQAHITIQPALARNWEYYTGIVFELQANGFHVGGGGRYDELARVIGGKRDVPAVGFAYYADQLLFALLPSLDEDQQLAVTLTFDDGSALSAAGWSHLLHQESINVRMLPSDSFPLQGKLLAVESDSTLRFNGKTFTPDQIHLLIAALK
jgi:histidyl-tRNA synthetase